MKASLISPARIRITGQGRHTPGALLELLRAAPYLLPALLIFVVFTYYPLARVLYMSLTDADMLSAPNWVGLANYRQLLADREFWNSLGITAAFAVWGRANLWNEPLGQDHGPSHFALVSRYADHTAKEPRCQDGITAAISNLRWSARSMLACTPPPNSAVSIHWHPA
ncbi:carbohydrate ABC transporter permease [Deinococcus frigens]|uniref:carbohydrate ABC transporter permease n=1 Tax=Deinococcus frigens TaxID=249403 RepID=UPI0039EEC55E